MVNSNSTLWCFTKQHPILSKSNEFGNFELDQIVLYYTKSKIYILQHFQYYTNNFTILILQSTNNTWCGSKKYNETQKLRTDQSG